MRLKGLKAGCDLLLKSCIFPRFWALRHALCNNHLGSVMVPSTFLVALDALPHGFSTGLYDGKRWNCTLKWSADGRRGWLLARQAGGSDHVSLNLFRLRDGRTIVKPCEMPREKVVAFVERFEPDDQA